MASWQQGGGLVASRPLGLAPLPATACNAFSGIASERSTPHRERMQILGRGRRRAAPSFFLIRSVPTSPTDTVRLRGHFVALS